jgi:uncharacterized membrane protein
MSGMIYGWHAIFVHFTVGLLFTAWLFYVVAWLAPRRPLWRTGMLLAARWNLAAGIVITIATLVSGAYAASASAASLPIHRVWSYGAMAAFVAVGMFGWLRIRRFKEPTPLFIALLTAATVILLIATYSGYVASTAI